MLCSDKRLKSIKLKLSHVMCFYILTADEISGKFLIFC